MAEERKDIDPVTGIATTGHEWDGLRELNTPLPRWWLWLFYLTIVWSIGYWIVYPAWPLLTTSTQGVFGYHTRSAVADDLEALKRQRGPMVEKLAAASLSSIVADPQLLDFARAQGRVAFADNCAPCHGAGGGGAKGYPNLNDDDWLWGGKLTDIEHTIRYGARAGDDKGRAGTMPAFGRDNILKPNEISAVADYTRSLSGLPTEPGNRSCPWQESVRRQLRRLPRARGQGEPRGRRAKPHGQDLALWRRKAGHHPRHPERARRCHAGLGRPLE